MPIKTFTPSVLTSADVNTYLMQQSVIICTSGTRPGSPINGMTIYETDTECYATYSGSAWIRRLGGIWANYTPTLTNITLGNGTMVGKWTLVGATVMGSVRIVAGTTTAYGAGQLGVSIPTAAASWVGSIDTVGSGWVDNGSGVSRRGTTLQIIGSEFRQLYEGGTVSNTAPFTFGTASRISLQFFYERA